MIWKVPRSAFSSRVTKGHSPRSVAPTALYTRVATKTISEVMARWSTSGDRSHLADAQAFANFLAPLRRAEWVVYSKRPFGGPEAVLAYLSRYTHRVAIANSRLITCDQGGVTFKWKDYRVEGRAVAKSACASNIARARALLAAAKPEGQPTATAVDPNKPSCPCCGGRMIIIEVFARGATQRHRPTAPTDRIRIDAS